MSICRSPGRIEAPAIINNGQDRYTGIPTKIYAHLIGSGMLLNITQRLTKNVEKLSHLVSGEFARLTFIIELDFQLGSFYNLGEKLSMAPLPASTSRA